MTPKRLEVFHLMVYALAGVWIGYFAPNLLITALAISLFALADWITYRIFLS